MRKILTTGIIVVLLCSALAVIVQAQSTPITNIVDVNTINGTIIHNSTFEKLSVDERLVVAQSAITNYLSGKTKSLIIPGGTIINVTPAPLTTQYYIIHAPAPIYSSTTGLNEQGVLPLLSTSLPQFNSNSSTYSATYLQFGGISDVGLPTQRIWGPNASIANAVFNYDGVNSLGTLDDGEIFVLHLWGTNSTGALTEDDLAIGKNAANPNLVDFTPYINTNNPVFGGHIASLPINDRIAVYIMALNPQGSSRYTQFNIVIFDANQMTWYRPPNYDVNQVQYACVVDMALEKDHNVAAQLNQWKIAQNYIAYDVNQNLVNLQQEGRVFEWWTPNNVTPLAMNAYYFDPSSYQNIPNAEANIYITRYSVWSLYPPHP